VLLLLAALAPPLLYAQLDHLGGDEDLDLIQKDDSDEFDKLVEGRKDPNYAGLRSAHLSYVTQWRFVRPERVKRGQKLAGPFHWQERRGLASPISDEPITALLEVPEAGEYRLLLRQVLDVEKKRPVELTIVPQRRVPESAEAEPQDDGAKRKDVPAPAATWQDSGTPVRHVFGDFQLISARTGRQNEQKLPVRFEAEHELIGPVLKPSTVWEYWDTRLERGVYRFALQSAARSPEVHSLFLSLSKDFRPSFTSDDKHRVFDRLHLRFRVHNSSRRPETYNVSAGLTYHWRGRPVPGSTEPAWGWRVGSAQKIPLDKWSPFIEATDAMVPGPGPWSTCRMGFGGVGDGEAEIQFAWFPHAGAVMHTVRTGIGDSGAMMRVPHGNGTVRTKPTEPRWGMWEQGYLARVQPEGQIVERYFEWAKDAEQKLGIGPDHPRPRIIHITTSCRVGPAYRARAAEMLAILGVNWVEGAPQSVVEKYGLHDEWSAYHVSSGEGLAKGKTSEQRAKLTKVKVGDEIGTYTDPSAINGNLSRREAFHAYLREQAAAEGMSVFEFLGVSDLGKLDCLGALPPEPGRFQRRLYYHSHRFCHLASVPHYKRVTDGFHQFFPNVNVYNNYSPHPVFLTGTTMNHTDWFVLCRNRAQSLAWGEDWAWGSWNLRTREWCVSFYAALVDCAARKHHYPSGFYVGSNCANSARKLFSCLAHGLTWLHLYDWGPIDGWAEGSNSWSERASEYGEVMTGCCALGPAEAIVAGGKRWPRKAAVLYNRSNEIIHGGAGRLNHDWMWTFIGLKCAKVPTEVILEEDLNAEALKGYEALILGGWNLEKRRLLALREWVEGGGLLIGAGGFAYEDVYQDPMRETVELFGAEQRAAVETDGSTAQAAFVKSDLYPETTVRPAGPVFVLTPTTGKLIAAYDGGACAAVMQRVGKGTAILLGFQPGYTFRYNGQANGVGREWLEAPVLRTLGRPATDYTNKDCEVTRFDHETGIAILLNDFSRASKDGAVLSVRTEREVKEVTSGLRGPLEWKRQGDRIEITTKALQPVDTIILR